MAYTREYLQLIPATAGATAGPLDGVPGMEVVEPPNVLSRVNELAAQGWRVVTILVVDVDGNGTTDGASVLLERDPTGDRARNALAAVADCAVAVASAVVVLGQALRD